jgi:ABC-type maltose transport system permease subunit
MPSQKVLNVIKEIFIHIILLFFVAIVIMPIMYVVSAGFRANQAVYGPLIDTNSWADTDVPDRRKNKISKKAMLNRLINVYEGRYYFNERKISKDEFIPFLEENQPDLMDMIDTSVLSETEKALLEEATSKGNYSWSDEVLDYVYAQYENGFEDRKKLHDDKVKQLETMIHKDKPDMTGENDHIRNLKQETRQWIYKNGRGDSYDLFQEAYKAWLVTIDDLDFRQHVEDELFYVRDSEYSASEVVPRYRYEIRTSLVNFVSFFKGTIPNAKDAKYPMVSWLFNSLLIAGSVALIQVIIVALAAYAFSRFRFTGKKAGLMFVLTVQVFPGTMAMVALYLLLQYLGKIVPFIGIDTKIGLILVYLGGGIPLNIWLVKGYFDTIPKSLEESAMIDGATYWQSFLIIILPLVRPILAVLTLLSFVGIYNEFVLAAVVITKIENYTLPLGLRFFINTQQDARFGVFSAACIIGSVPIVGLWLMLQNQIIAGLTQGSVKG